MKKIGFKTPFNHIRFLITLNNLRVGLPRLFFGADSLVGGKGNDTYVVDNVGDRLADNANVGSLDLLTVTVHELGQPNNIRIILFYVNLRTQKNSG